MLPSWPGHVIRTLRARTTKTDCSPCQATCPAGVSGLRPSVASDGGECEGWSKQSVKAALHADEGHGFSCDTAAMPWQRAEHCMLCYLGVDHKCEEPAYVLDAQAEKPIKRKMLFAALGEQRDKDALTGFGGVASSIVMASTTYLVRYEPDMCTGEAEHGFPHHVHAYGEEYLVLRGSFHDSSVRAPTLTWVLWPPGSSHSAHPEDCDVLTWWGQMDPSRYRANPLPWWTAEMHEPTAPKVMSIVFSDPRTDPNSAWTRTAFGYRLVLFSGGMDEETFVERWSPNTTYTEPSEGGPVERFVVEGSIWERGKERKAGWWMRRNRVPPGGVRRSGDQGCTVICKSNHTYFLAGGRLHFVERIEADDQERPAERGRPGLDPMNDPIIFI